MTRITLRQWSGRLRHRPVLQSGHQTESRQFRSHQSQPDPRSGPRGYLGRYRLYRQPHLRKYRRRLARGHLCGMDATAEQHHLQRHHGLRPRRDVSLLPGKRRYRRIGSSTNGRVTCPRKAVRKSLYADDRATRLDTTVAEGTEANVITENLIQVAGVAISVPGRTRGPASGRRCGARRSGAYCGRESCSTSSSTSRPPIA